MSATIVSWTVDAPRIPKGQVILDLQSAGFGIADDAVEMIEGPKFFVDPGPRRIRYAMVSFDGIGLGVDESTDVVLDEARLARYGLRPCTPSGMYHLRSTYHDQPMGHCVRIGMCPMGPPDTEPRIFTLWAARGKRWVGSTTTHRRLPMEEARTQNRSDDAGKLFSLAWTHHTHIIFERIN